MKNIKLVCFDVDETLVDGTSWWILTESLGCPVQDNIDTFNQATRGEISFIEAERVIRERYQNSGNANRSFIKNVFENIEVKNEAKEIIPYLKKKGYKVYLISGAMDIYVESVAKKLGADGFYANSSLEFDEKGILRKIHYRENQEKVKLEQLHDLISKLGVNMSQVVFVGDSENDIEVFKATQHGIAVNSFNEDLKKVSWKTVNSLSEIKNIL